MALQSALLGIWFDLGALACFGRGGESRRCRANAPMRRGGLRSLLPVALLVLVSSGAAASDTDETRTVSGPADSERSVSVLVFGDSLSAAYGLDVRDGWVEMLARSHNAEDQGFALEVYNASISGETSAGGRSRLAEALADASPDVVLLQLGANDGLRGLSLDRMRENLVAMIDMIDAQGADTVLLGVYLPTSHGARYRRAFDAVYTEVSEDERVAAFHPFFIESVALEPDLMQEDAVHPNAAAQEAILETVRAVAWPVIRARGEDR